MAIYFLKLKIDEEFPWQQKYSNISNYDSEEFVVLSSMQNNYCASQLSDLL